MNIQGQHFVGRYFTERLFQALHDGGRMKIFRPNQTEEFDLRDCTVTFHVEKEEIVIHHGIKTTPILVLENWISVQYLPGALATSISPARPSFFLFRKEGELAFEIIPTIRQDGTGNFAG